jgi:hypothetical protein
VHAACRAPSRLNRARRSPNGHRARTRTG